MGIPKFYRWLTGRYPFIVGKVRKEDDVPPVDNFYIDLNGLIHNVVHGNSDDRLILTSHMISSGNIDELWGDIFSAIDDLVHLVNPRRLLFIALDSSTPVAKMTQQRARRIRGESAVATMDDLAKNQDEKELLDISAISPGTEFMDTLNKQLDFFIQSKIHEDPLYQRIKVIFSDSNTPGEGEHKIMEYMRCYKLSPEYDPNTRHCVYGLDADLIMLGLVSHEPHSMIIRDITDSHSSRDSVVIGLVRPNILKVQEYEVLYVSVLREYFEAEFKFLAPLLPFKYDLERIIDDFIFFSFFVGNDFLPYLNTVDINYGSLDMIIRVYKQILPKLKDYITSSGEVMWENAELIFAELGKSELRIFKERMAESTDTRHTKERFHAKDSSASESEGGSKSDPAASPAVPSTIPSTTPSAIPPAVPVVAEVKEKAATEKEPAPAEDEDEKDKEVNVPLEKSKQFDAQMCALYEKDVDSAKKLYYAEKLHIDITTEEGKKTQREIIRKYLEGLQWVLYYYYKGVKHWGWYYPYHYAPLVSDIHSLKDYMHSGKELRFELKEPNRPLTTFEQLLCILPRASMTLLPSVYHALYSPTSEIADMYPEQYAIDFNGRSMPWEAIKLIPFVDVCRVLEAEKKLLSDPKTRPLTDAEKARNAFHTAVEYVYAPVPTERIVESTIKEMPKLINPKCAKKLYVLPVKPETVGFAPRLAKGVEIHCPDFPSLRWLNIAGCEVEPLDAANPLFDKVTLVIPDTPMPADRCEDLLGKSVYVDYPFQHEARVVSVITKTHVLASCFNPVSMVFETVKTPQIDPRPFEDTAKRMLRWGVRCGLAGDFSFICYCAPMEYITKNFQGAESYSKAFGMKPSLYPSPVVMLARDPRNYLNCDKWISTQTLQYPVGAPCAIIHGKDFGSVGVIADSSAKQVKVMLHSSVDTKILDSISDLCKPADKSAAKYTPLYQIGKKLGISKYAVGKVISGVKIKVRERGVEKKFNVGLSLIHFVLKLHIPYHFQYDVKNHDWMVSPDVVQCLEDYIKRCPMLFHVLDVCEGNRALTAFKASVVFPNEADPDQAAKELFAWVRSLPLSKLPFVPMGAQVINQTVHEQISQKLLTESDVKRVMLETTRDPLDILVERYPFWIRPFGAKSINDFRPGDRVICIRTCGLNYVPFGCAGTVVGMQGRRVLVDFDQQMVTGTSFCGMCGKSQGRVVDGYSLLNLCVY